MASQPEPLAITAARVVTPGGVLQNATLVTDGERILGVTQNEPPRGVTQLVFEDATLLPGFIDLHVHGGGGWRVGVDTDLLNRPDADPDPLVNMSRFMASTGVTGFQPTLSTASKEEMLATVTSVARLVGQDLPGADVLGTHLEGPYLNAARKGAQREEFIRPPDREEFLEVWQASRGTARYVTLAPELQGAAEFTEWLTGLGVFVSAGHTDARAEDMERAYAAGLKGVTHLFNAMRGLQKRHRHNPYGRENRTDVYCSVFYPPVAIAASLCSNRFHIARLPEGRHSLPICQMRPRYFR